MNKDIRDCICDMGFEDAVLFIKPDFDNAIVGVTEEGQVVYDFDKMVEDMAQRDGISGLEAIEFIGYNTMRAIPYMPNPKPIIMYSIEGGVRREE